MDARKVGEISVRSIAGQIEFWATLGKSLEQLLGFSEVAALMQAGGKASLRELIDNVDTDLGKARLAASLKSRPFPHFEPADKKGLYVRISEDGKKTLGQFKGKSFVPLKTASHARARG